MLIVWLMAIYLTVNLTSRTDVNRAKFTRKTVKELIGITFITRFDCLSAVMFTSPLTGTPPSLITYTINKISSP